MSALPDEDGNEQASRPQFKGCIFCYSAEWIVHGAKKVADAIHGRD